MFISRRRHAFLATILLCVVSRSSAGSSGWTTLEAPRAGLRVETPHGWRLSEIVVQGAPGDPRTVTLIRLTGGGPEPALSETADVEIYVHARPALVSLRDWVGQKGGISGGDVQQDSVGGHAALSRRTGGRERLRDIFAFASDRALRVAVPERAATASVSRRVLDSVVLIAPAAPVRATATGTTGVVRPAILSPADVPLRPDYPIVMRKAFENLQVWFRNSLDNTMTVTLAEIGRLSSDKPAEWFATNPAGSDPGLWFWRNSTSEGLRLTGGSFGDPANTRLFYVDAQRPCEQFGVATGSVGVFDRYELRGLSNQSIIPHCTDEGTGYRSACSFVGGAGWLFGATLGLDPPEACTDSDEGTPCPNNLMWTGLYLYPRTELDDDQKARLIESGFVAPLDLPRPLHTCDKLFAPPALFF
jgi:hypothetical protein